MNRCPSCQRRLVAEEKQCPGCDGGLEQARAFQDWLNSAELRPVSVREAARRDIRPARPFRYDLLGRSTITIRRNGTERAAEEVVRGSIFSHRPLSNIDPGQQNGDGAVELDPAPASLIRSKPIFFRPTDAARRRQVHILKALQLRALSRDELSRVRALQERLDDRRSGLF